MTPARADRDAPRRGSSGQGLVEYGLILALDRVLTVLWLVVFGGAMSDALTAIGHRDRPGDRRLTGRTGAADRTRTIVSVR